MQLRRRGQIPASKTVKRPCRPILSQILDFADLRILESVEVADLRNLEEGGNKKLVKLYGRQDKSMHGKKR